MNNCLKFENKKRHQLTTVTHYGGMITAYDSERNSYIVDHDYHAQCATSLLLKPAVGDQVVLIEMQEKYYICQILTQTSQAEELLIESDKPVQWVAPKLKFSALQEVELISLNRLSFVSKHCMISIAGSLIQQTENLIQQVAHYSLAASGLLRLTGKQQIITAEEDVRIDGKRINMG